MIRIVLFFISTFGFLLSGFSQDKANEFAWPGGQKVAVSLSYDDALDSQLDNAIPALDKYNLKASFYVVPNSSVMKERLEEWRVIAENGHELGNHSIYHPCRGSLPNREWVPPHHDLDNYSVAQMIEEVTTANTFLKAVDGNTERTFTPPCLDSLAGGEDYLSKVRELFIAIKGAEFEPDFFVLMVPVAATGKELVEYIKTVPTETSLVNIIFHGIGGDHLSVSSEAHMELLKFLSDNDKTFYVDTYINIAKHANTFKE
jgi:hypothetical protein